MTTTFQGSRADQPLQAHFVMSTTPDDLISQIEDLYARYFERGNHKLAVGKLRARVAKAGDYTGAVFRTGILLALGAVFGIQGMYNKPTQRFNTADARASASETLESGNRLLMMYTKDSSTVFYASAMIHFIPTQCISSKFMLDGS